MRKKRWVRAVAHPSNGGTPLTKGSRKVKAKKKKRSVWEEVSYDETTSSPYPATPEPTPPCWFEHGDDIISHPITNPLVNSEANGYHVIQRDNGNAYEDVPKIRGHQLPRTVSSPALTRHKIPPLSLMSPPTELEDGYDCDPTVYSELTEVQEIANSEPSKLHKHISSQILDEGFTGCYAWPLPDDIFETCEFLDDIGIGDGSKDSSALEKPDDNPGSNSETLEAAYASNNEDTDQSSASVQISNIDGETAIEDIRSEFPRAISITIKHLKSGQLPEAVVQFTTREDADAAFERTQLKKLGYRRLEWVHSNEIVIENITADVTKEDIKKRFPQVRRIKRRYLITQAILQFTSAEKAAEAFSTSGLVRAGDRCLKWATSKRTSNDNEGTVDDYCSDPERTILVSDVEEGSELEAKRLFPNAKTLRVRRNSRGRHTIAVKYESAVDAEMDYRGSGLRKLDWVFPDEVKVENVPVYATESDFKIRFPKHISMKYRSDGRTVILKFRNREEAEQAAADSGLIQLGNRGLRWTWTEPCESNDADPEANEDTWEAPHYDTNEPQWQNKKAISNISNLFTKKVYVSHLPSWFTVAKLRKIYPKALKIELSNWKKRKVAVIEFENTLLAAKACYATQRLRVHGKKLKASPRKPAGFKRKQKNVAEQDEMKLALSKVCLKDI